MHHPSFAQFLRSVREQITFSALFLQCGIAYLIVASVHRLYFSQMPGPAQPGELFLCYNIPQISKIYSPSPGRLVDWLFHKDRHILHVISNSKAWDLIADGTCLPGRLWSTVYPGMYEVVRDISIQDTKQIYSHCLGDTVIPRNTQVHLNINDRCFWAVILQPSRCHERLTPHTALRL